MITSYTTEEIDLMVAIDYLTSLLPTTESVAMRLAWGIARSEPPTYEDIREGERFSDMAARFPEDALSREVVTRHRTLKVLLPLARLDYFNS